YFNEVSNFVGEIREGDRAACWIEDINGDDVHDLFYGIANGGLVFFVGDSEDNVWETNTASPDLGLYPNPATQETRVVLKRPSTGTLQVFDMRGRITYSKALNGEMSLIIPVSNWQQGIYLVEWIDRNERHVRKLVVN
ncbi:MAG: hypothetical protein ACJA15_002716, partial [Flavobacteriales bacterium]